MDDHPRALAVTAAGEEVGLMVHGSWLMVDGSWFMDMVDAGGRW